LRAGYPGYFSVGDSAALRKQLLRAESDEGFYEDLQRWVARLHTLVSPALERESWAALVRQVR